VEGQELLYIAMFVQFQAKKSRNNCDSVAETFQEIVVLTRWAAWCQCLVFCL